MTAQIMMKTLDRPATQEEIENILPFIHGDLLELSDTSRTRGTLWERVAERTCQECGTISHEVWIELCPSCREHVAASFD